MIIFFFKQKTAYEMRISDWSSDVCSSDLPAGVYMAELGGKRGWLDYHLGNGTAFGLRLLAALMSIEATVPGLGNRLAVELAQEIGRASCRERVCQYG